MYKVRKSSFHRFLPCALAAAAISLVGSAGVHGAGYATGQTGPSVAQDKADPSRAAPAPMELEGAPIRGNYGSKESGITAAKEMLGKPAHAEAGGELGEVHDVILSAENVPTSVIITSGGFLGIGSKDVVLPWKSVNYDPAERIVRVSAIDKEQFERLSAYKSSDSVNTLRKLLAQDARERIQMNRDAERAPAPNQSPIPGK